MGGCTSAPCADEAEEAARWRDFGPAAQPSRHGLARPRERRTLRPEDMGIAMSEGNLDAEEHLAQSPPLYVSYESGQPPPYRTDDSEVPLAHDTNFHRPEQGGATSGRDEEGSRPPEYTFGCGVLKWTVEDVCTCIHQNEALRHLEQTVFRGRLINGECLLALNRADLLRYAVVDTVELNSILSLVQLLRVAEGLGELTQSDIVAQKSRQEYCGKGDGIDVEAVRCGRIRRIKMQSVNLTTQQLQLIVKASVGGGAYITWISLKGNELGRAHADLIAEFITRSRWLSVLDLGGNNFDDKSIRPIATAIASSRGLRDVNLDHNDLGPASGAIFAAVVTGNAMLRSISLYWNALGDEGGRTLLNALRLNQGLQLLDVSYNGLGRQCANAISVAIRENRGLQTLQLAENDLGFHAGLAIAEALEQNSRLRSLDLSDNRLGTATVQIILAWGEGRKGALNLHNNGQFDNG
eukprot:m.110793 g.110793  ORF g.110793 m.110793 type:complete len:466 (+) comp12903_c0_seq2:2401-3798(+)